MPHSAPIAIRPTNVTSTKAAERARLSTLFDKLASRKPQASSSVSCLDANANDSSFPKPQEFSTVLKNLYSIMQRKAPDESAVAWPSSTPMEVDHDGTTENDVEHFPLAEEKKYPFTFKHMIHKLYKKDEWERTVKEVLERSKKEFKPLAETELNGGVRSPTSPKFERLGGDVGEADELGRRRAGEYTRRVSAGTGVQVRSRPRSGLGCGGDLGLGQGTRRRSQSVIQGRKGAVASPTSQAFNISTTRSVSASASDTLRPLKKRCIGKRKSMRGIFEERTNEGGSCAKGDGTTTKDTRAFEVAISSTEHYIPGVYSPWSSPPTSPRTPAFGQPQRSVVDYVVASSQVTTSSKRKNMQRPSLAIDIQLSKQV